MSTAITTIFGNEIRVGAQPRRSQRQYVGYPGAHGLSALHMGSRGRKISVNGTLRATGESYAAARATLEAAITTIEAWQWAAVEDMTYGNMTYYNCLLDSFQLTPGQGGKVFHFTGSYVIADFIATFVELI